jgi:hypothetical protein
MRAIYGLVLLLTFSCGGSARKSEATSPGQAPTSADSKESKPGKYCTKYDICFDDVNRSDYASDEELMCAQYCTYYCACYEEVEGEECYEGGGCVLNCEGGMSKEDEREDWLRRIRCSQEADCNRFLDEC